MGRLLTAQEVAAMTSLSPETLYTWAARKRTDVPTGFKLGGRRVWDEDEIRAWIDQQRQAATS